MSNPDDRDVSSDKPEQPPPELVGPSNRQWIIGISIALILYLLLANSGRFGRWWEHKKKQVVYVDLMILEEGDIKLRDSGGYFDRGKFKFLVAIDNELPSSGMGGIDDTKFVANWQVSIVVDSQEIHSAKWSGSAKPFILYGSCSTPRYESVQEYIDNGAVVRIRVTQQGSDILIATQALTEKRQRQLDLPDRSSGMGGMFWFQGPADLSFRRGRQLLQDGQIDEAIIELDSSISDCPLQPEAYQARGEAYIKKQELDLAISDFLEAIRLSKADFNKSKKFAQLLKKEDDFMEARLVSTLDNHTLLELYNNMAFEYATCTSASHRHGSKSLSLAEQICEATDHKSAKYLTTLALAHAECGDFEQAAKTAKKAQELLDETHSRQLKADLRKALKLFDSKQPFRR